MRKILLLSSMIIGLVVAGCSGDDGGGDDGSNGGDANCYDYSSFTATDVSLKTDVMPIFQQSCSFAASCHGTDSPAGKMYLAPSAGTAPTDDEIAKMIAQNVGADSSAGAGMPRVTAGDASKSFLMHKIDGTLKCGDLACAADESCGAPMPLGSPAIDKASADKVRSWIEQGAQNN